jgi:hypothetical protein
MKTFYFNSGVKPWNTDVKRELAKGHKFVNNELQIPFDCEDVPENASLAFLGNDISLAHKNLIAREVHNTTMCSKYAFFNVY